MPLKPTHTKPSSFRFSSRTLQLADEISDSLGGASRTTVFTLAVTALHQRLGLKTRDAIAAVESITRMHGDQASVVVTLTDPGRGYASIEIGGVAAGDDWTAWVQTGGVADDGEPIGSAGFYCRWEPKSVTFTLGEVADAMTGSKITVRAGDLTDLVLLRSEADESKSPAERRRDLKAEFEMRREISRLLAKQGLDPVAGGGDDDEDEM